MSINNVSIDSYNIPILCHHEVFLHSLSHVNIHAEWGQGYPGCSGEINSFQGGLYLTPFRLIFVPEYPNESLYSVSFPLSKLSHIKHSFQPIEGPRDYNDRFTIPKSLLSDNDDEIASNLASLDPHAPARYIYKQSDIDHTLSFMCSPCHNSRVPELDLYRNIITADGQRPEPRLDGYLPHTRVDYPITVHITLPSASSCTVHRPGNNTPSGIICYHQDFLYSLLRGIDMGIYIMHVVQHLMKINSGKQLTRQQILQELGGLVQTYTFPTALKQCSHENNNNQPKPVFQSSADKNAKHKHHLSSNIYEYELLEDRDYDDIIHRSSQIRSDASIEMSVLASPTHSSASSAPQYVYQRLDSPLLLGHALAGHTQQPLELLGLVAHVLGIHPLEVYSEWGPPPS